ncbi:hypothetical protein [Lachnobacterium bovis]|uniref:Uncharacterized protein n=1 Tax=Lachnobacterium bovis TaxID=140626 RepID=A0A1H9QZX7_9FIRM|nr:hypothetical protein [Lachnobacterium bovis]SER65263.1 hypothetical protein SAMN02910429_00680 [Lachnobacterium bovis]
MRYSKVCEITKIMFVFFQRNVLNVGLLNKKIFRLFIIGVVVLLTAFLSFELYNFFESTNSSQRQIGVILDSYSCSVFMWTFVAFIFVKILFMKKGSFLEFTDQMPVTKQEKNISILIFEICTALSVVIIFSLALIITLITRDGSAFITRIICNIFFNCVTIYFVFELLYSIFGIFCNYMGLEKVKNIIVICILSLLLVGFYLVIIPDVFLSILYTYKDNTGTASILFYMVVTEKYGILASTILFVVINSILGFLIVHIPNNDANCTNKYARTCRFIMKKSAILSAYVVSFLRKVDTINYYFIAVFSYLITIVMKIDKGYYVILILSLNSLYAYVETESLRNIIIQKKYSVVKDYCRIIMSQIIYISVLAIPVCIVDIFLNKEILFIVDLFVAIIFSVVFFTMAGILFPAKNENPFSAMVGIMFIIMIGLIAVSVCFFLKLNEKSIIVFMVLLSVASVSISIFGMNKLYGKLIHS